MTDDPIRESVARAIRTALTENWHDVENARKWDEDVLLTGCQKVGGGLGYLDPKYAAERLARDASDAALLACGYEEMRRALETMLNGCDRYDDDPESLVAMEAYLSGKERARAALSRTQGETK